MQFRRRLLTITSVGILAGLILAAAPLALADLPANQAATLSASGVPVLVPGSGQPFSDQVPTTVQADANGYEIDYGTAPTFSIRGSASDSRLLVPRYVCGDDTSAYCTDVGFTSATGDQTGDEIFRGLEVAGAPATVEHFTCCNGVGWSIEWSDPNSGAWYSVMWKGDVAFAPSDTPAFDPNNSQYAQAFAGVAAGLAPLSPPGAELAREAPANPPSVAPAPLCGAPPNPWSYGFCGSGPPVSAPPSNFCAYFNCIPTFWRQTNGYVSQCADGAFSHSGGVRGACSGHGGVSRTLRMP